MSYRSYTIGTSHFVSRRAALRYYKPSGFGPKIVDRKVEDGSIHIGKPKLGPGETLSVIKDEGRYAITRPVDMDRTPRYAPDRTITVKDGVAWTCPVIQHVAHPPGSKDRPSWIDPELVALEMKTAKGSSWYGFEKAYINSELRMVVVGFNTRDEVLRKWEICTYP